MENLSDAPYRTLVLGTQQSGKTVYLSSLYKRLSVAQPEKGTSFFLDSENGRSLLSKFHRLEVDKKWPERTPDFENYEFKLRTNINRQDHNGNVKLEVCDHLVYQFCDIPGQSITDVDTNTEWATRLEKLAEKTVNFLILIDGEKVLKAINYNEKAELYSQLDFILPLIQRVPGKPLHFLITKWDLIENQANPLRSSSEQLERVQKELMNYPNFQGLIYQLSDIRTPARLLPVSAVGKNFAILRSEKMEIIPGVMPEPFNVELPIALMLWDGLRLAQNQISGNLKNNQATIGNLMNFKKLLDVFGQILDIIPATPETTITKLGLSSIVKIIQSFVEKMVPKQENKLIKLSEENQNLQKVLNEFSKMTKDLEVKFPSSKLVDF